MDANRLRLVVDNTRNEIEPYEDDIPLLDLKEELTGNDRRNGYIGWIATAAAVGAWDLSKNETMTNAYRRGLAHPIGRFVVPLATSYTVAHLHGLIPKRWDAFDQLAERVGRWKK